MRVTVFGLGSHGGGAAAARYFAESGCTVTVTDRSDRRTLQASVDALCGLEDIRFVLGEHRKEDFLQADLVIKNPAIPWSHPMLQHAGHIETDISWFLRRTQRPVIAVSGTKGKTTLAMLIGHLITPRFPRTDVGGNMGRSPFLFCNEASADPVVLELSSWQLGDLRRLGCPPPLRIALLTSLFPDHLDSYGSYREYVKDKSYLFSDAFEGIIPAEVLGQREFTAFPMMIEKLWTVGRYNGNGYITQTGNRWEVFERTGGRRCELEAADVPWRDHAMAASLAALLVGITPQQIARQLRTFVPPKHRCEYVCSLGGSEYWDDSSATVPESVLRSVCQFQGKPIHLITGGTDKGLSPRLYQEIFSRCASVHLLAGSFTEKLLHQCPGPYFGPFSTMEEAVSSAAAQAQGDTGVILLSPGAASFEHFLHAQKRGEAFQKAALSLSGQQQD